MLLRRERAMVAVSIMLDVAFHGSRHATVNAAEIAQRLGLARRGMEPVPQLKRADAAGLPRPMPEPLGGPQPRLSSKLHRTAIERSPRLPTFCPGRRVGIARIRDLRSHRPTAEVP